MSALDEILAQPETFAEGVAAAPVIPEQEVPAQFGGALGMQMTTRPATVEVQPAEEGAGFASSFKAGFVDDPGTQLRILATDRFPDLDPQDALKRFGFIDGNPVFVNEQGDLEQAQGGLADLMGSIAAESPEIVGAVAGTFMPMPVLGSALGAATGEATKKILANVFLDEPQTVGGNILAIGGEAALDLAFGGAAKGVTEIVNKRAIAAGEKAINPKALLEAREQIFKATGIELDIAQVSGIPQLVQLKRWASKAPGEAAAIIQASDDLIAGQSQAAITRIIDMMSSGDATAKLGIKGINAAQAAITAAKVERNHIVSPLYKKAFQDPVAVNTSETLALIDKELVSAKGPIASIMKTTRKLFNSAADPKALDETVLGLHNTRRAIDAMIETKRAGSQLLNEEMVAKLVQVRTSLTDDIASASLAYKVASDRFAAESARIVDPLINSPVGILAKIKDANATTAAARILGGNAVDPVTIRLARNAITKIDPAAWDGVVAQWLQSNLTRASKELATGQAVNVAGKFRQAVIGTNVQKAAMREALGPNAVKMFNEVMDALQKVASTPLAGSETAFFQLINRKLDSGTFSMLQSILSPRKTLLDAQSQRFMDSLSKSIADGLTNPAKIQELNRLFALKPSSERAVLITSLMLGQTAAAGVSSELSGGDQVPPLLQQTQPQPARSVLDDL